MKRYWKILSYLVSSVLMSAVWILNNVATAGSEKDAEIEYLINLKLDELSKVEVTLDSVFDVFDGLIKKRRTKVASGLKQSTARAPAVTTVITAQDIEAMGARTLEEVLRSVPGLQVSFNQVNVPVYSIRGVSSTYNPEVLVLINGLRFNDNYIGSKGLYWSGFPVSQIAQIEIMRGPGSALYGADALTGVVNIVTKQAQDIETPEIGMRIGDFATRDAWLLYGTQWQGFDISAMADINQTEGHQRLVDSDAQSVFDRNFDTQASLAPGAYGSKLNTYDLRLDVAKQAWRFRLGLHKANDFGIGLGSAQALDSSDAPVTMETINSDISYHNPNFTKHWALTAQLSYLHADFDATFQIFPPGAFGGEYPIGYLGYPAWSESQAQFSLSGIYQGMNNHLIRLGAGYAYYDLYETRERKNFGLHPDTGEPLSPLELFDVTDTSAIYMPEVSRSNYFMFLQDSWILSSNWELTSGIRYDRYSDFGSTLNPRMGLVWETTPKLTSKLLFGQAFRAPSFQDMHNKNNPISRGNLDLQPEKMTSWEFAFDYRPTETLNLALSLFRYKITDKITLVPLGHTEFTYANAASWQGYGGEFELRWKINAKSSLLLNYSYQNSEDQFGAVLPNASQQTAFLRGDYLLRPHWYLNTQINWNDGWARVVNDPRPALDGYATLDLIMRYKNTRDGKLNFAIGLRNLFDADVRYPSPGPDPNNIVNAPNDIPGAGRFWFIEGRYLFN
jgi:iron complex outermembrane receptor protein